MDEREEKHPSAEHEPKHERDQSRDPRDLDEVRTVIEEISIEEVGIDGMCGVY